MKIGVLTHWTGADNYGQQLQIYALQQHLKRMGHSAFLIRSIIASKRPKERYAVFKNMIRTVLRLFSNRRRQLYRAAIADKKLRKTNEERNKERDFIAFRDQWLEMSDIIHSYEELLSNPPSADIYIVGSDQVWNPQTDDENIGAWYLRFGAPNIKRISYAASFGRRINEDENERLTHLLGGLDSISVREQGALNTLHELGFATAKLVLDPTLLADREIYRPFLSETYNGAPYAFVYYLNIKSTEELAWPQIETYLHENNLELKSATASGYGPARELIPGHQSSMLTIPSWIDTLYHSQCVVTTSFHGLAFAILMHRPFVVILLQGGLRAANERVLSLLELLQLHDRILNSHNTVSSIMMQPIDWQRVDDLLNSERIKSNRFLEEALRSPSLA